MPVASALADLPWPVVGLPCREARELMSDDATAPQLVRHWLGQQQELPCWLPWQLPPGTVTALPCSHVMTGRRRDGTGA